ncbi:MAG: phospholipid carrier-dependent glycosyltransferase [Propionibacteriaceae bacterium]|nr:phospholipid carrier-dependent glycosyltransferase [Propionibacteriaceae bacterium]
MSRTESLVIGDGVPADEAPAQAEPRRRWWQLPHPVTGQPQIPPHRSTIDRLRNPLPDDWNVAWLIALGITALAFILRVVHLGRPEGMVFDEIYYAKDAYSLLQSGFERNWVPDSDAAVIAGDFSGLEESGSFIVHPPVGKWLIALGIQAFGFNAFGFRLPSVLAGCGLLLVVFFLARRLSRSTMIGAIAALLLSLDGLHFTMSRIALLDIFQAFFTVAAILALVIDRDWFRRRLADHLEAAGLRDLQGQFGPLVLWRPWRLVAGVLFALACATKWNSIYALAVFSVLSVVWDLGARRLAGAGGARWRSLITDAPVAFFYQVVVALPVYLLTWLGWLTSDGGYSRNYGAEHPDAPAVRVFGNALGSLWNYHTEIYGCHTGEGIKEATHVYEAHPAGWLFMARPIGIDAVNDIQPGTDGCPDGTETCLRVISGMGTPLLWWIGVFALVAALVLWIGNRDWRFGVPVLGLAATWLTWFPNAERPLFFFYAIVIIPFTCVAIALCLGALIGPMEGRTRRAGGIVAGVLVALIALNFAYLYPVLTDTLLTYSQWLSRMWFKSWI